MCLFYWAVGGNCDFQQTFTDSFLETKVAPSLSNYHKPSPLERFDDSVER